MAYIDYGSVVKKNGIIIQKEMFMDMKKAVGFRIKSIKQSYKETVYEDDENYKPHTPKHYDYNHIVDGNYFSYIGDKDLLVCVVKCRLLFISNGRIIKCINGMEEDMTYWWWERKSFKFEVNGVKFYIKRLADNRGRYKLRFEYKGDLYEVLYGYGVDVNKNLWYDLTPKERRYINNWFK